MSHFGNNIKIETTTPPEWLRTGARIGQLVNQWSIRNDLAVLMSDTIDAPIAARYSPDTSEIEVNILHAFGAVTPELLGDITERKVQYDNPQAVGAIFHEACHARFSRYSLEAASKELDKNEFAALTTLEETRCEGWGAKTLPEQRGFLRYSALSIALADANEVIGSMESVRAAAFLSGLALARVDCGVLEDVDVFTMREAVVRVLGEDTLEKLRSVWLRFQAHADHSNAEPLYALAREWEAIVRAAAIEKGQDPDGEGQEDGEGEGSGFGGSGELSEAMRELLEALEQDAENAPIGAQRDLDDQQTKEEWAETAQAKAQQSKQQNSHKQTAKVIFDKPKRGDEPASGSNSRLVETRKPTGKERAAAVSIGNALEKAKYRERDITVRHSVLPAGRLRTRAAVQGAALKAVGVHTPVEAWSKKVRKQTDEPTLTIGVMVDISGSMGSAMNPMASTAWIMSEAGRRVQARTAMVYYGSDVFATLKPGQHLTDVTVYTAPDHTEQFDRAFQALNGGLDLFSGVGARLLVVVSDGQYTNAEHAKATAWVKECQRNGVGVVWITFDGNAYSARGIVAGTDATVVNIDNGESEATAALAIGKAATEAMNRVAVRKMA
jgi:hypothetical protein